MPPSQLKRLKSSLREQGIIGPQQSKKQKKQASKNGASQDKRVQRNAALQGIREQFNPFEVKAPSRGNKYEFTNGKTVNGGVAKVVMGRPGVTKGLGEENVCIKSSHAYDWSLLNFSVIETTHATSGDAATEESRRYIGSQIW